ncbi:MAG: glycosyltransferase [Nanoarchaeota archaeon]|nr:glycosyltransferase [Nanoarchaeota archaeon]
MISIIIPTLNEEKYLPLLLDSIKKQTYKNYEVIVADANSKDKTVKIAKKYGCKVVLEPKDKKKNIGNPGKTRNVGVKHAKGDYLLFLDSDVILDKDFVKNVHSIIQKDHIELASFGGVPVPPNTIDNIIFWLSNVKLYLSSIFSCKCNGYCILSKKPIHKRINGFNQEGILSEDQEYMERASKIAKHKFYINPKVHVSNRRFVKDGRLNTCLEYAKQDIYRFFTKKELKNKNYRFGEY